MISIVKESSIAIKIGIFCYLCLSIYSIQSHQHLLFDGSGFLFNIITNLEISPAADWSRKIALMFNELPTIFFVKYFQVYELKTLSYIYGITLKLPFLVSMFLGILILKPSNKNLLLLPITSFFLRVWGDNYFIVSESNFAAELFWPMTFLCLEAKNGDFSSKRTSLFILLIILSSFTYQSFILFNLVFIFILRHKLIKYKVILVALLVSTGIQIYSVFTYYCAHCRNNLFKNLLTLSNFGVINLVLILLGVYIVYYHKKVNRKLLPILFTSILAVLISYFLIMIMPNYELHQAQRVYHTIIPLLVITFYLYTLRVNQRLCEYKTLVLGIICTATIYGAYCNFVWDKARDGYVKNVQQLDGMIDQKQIKNFIPSNTHQLINDYSIISKHILLSTFQSKVIKFIPTVPFKYTWAYPEYNQLLILKNKFGVIFTPNILSKYKATYEK